MFFRGRQPEASIWRRFRVSSDGFTFEQTDDLFTAHVVANAERVVDLFYALSEQLPPAVDIAIEDLRSGRTWSGEAIALPDVREAVARLKVLLARYGGVELAVFTSDDQLTLNPYPSCSSTREPIAGCICSRARASKSRFACARKAGKRIASIFPRRLIS